MIYPRLLLNLVSDYKYFFTPRTLILDLVFKTLYTTFINDSSLNLYSAGINFSVRILIQRCGDVETNPGPFDNKLSKFDD